MRTFAREKQELVDYWRNYLKLIEKFIDKIEVEISDASRRGVCSGKMCRNAENLINELECSLDAFGQYPWRNSDDDRYITTLRFLLNDLYASVYSASRIF